MPRFVIAGQPQEEPPFEVSLEKTHDGVSLRFEDDTCGQCVLEFRKDGVRRVTLADVVIKRWRASGLALDAEGKIEVR